MPSTFILQPALEGGDIDFERSRLHVREGKRNKDRSIPIGKGVLGKLKTHLEYWSPQKFIFEDFKNPGRAIATSYRNSEARGSGFTESDRLKIDQERPTGGAMANHIEK